MWGEEPDSEWVDADEFAALEQALQLAEQRVSNGAVVQPACRPVGTTPLHAGPVPPNTWDANQRSELEAGADRGAGAGAEARVSGGADALVPAAQQRSLLDVLGKAPPPRAPDGTGGRAAERAVEHGGVKEHAHVGLQLLASGRVAVTFPYSCTPVLDAVTAVPEACAPAGPGAAWTVPASAVHELCRTLHNMSKLAVKLELPHSIAAAAMEFAGSALLSPTVVEEVYQQVPADLRDAMFPFQRDGVRYVIARSGRALIGDEMGLGKTVQAIALLAAYGKDRPALILCPASLRDCWAAALNTWLPDELRPVGAIQVILNGAGVPEALRGAGRRGIVICPYSLVIKDPLLFKRHGFTMVVADESHCLKDGNAKRTQAAAPLLVGARRAVCLTGTPALSRPMELWSQLSALQPRLFTSRNTFGARFCISNRYGWGQGCSNGEELHAVLATTVLVRRLKADVLEQLPPKIRTRIVLPVKPSGEVSRLVARIAQLRAAGGDKNSLDRLTNELYVSTADMKASACADYMETLLEGSPPEAKFLFFAHHTVLLDTLLQRLQVAKVRTITIAGSTPVGERAALVARFQNDPDVRVALLSIKAAGVGLTLTAASTVVFGELTWTPGDIVQAEDRAHRIGQRGSVAVHILQAPGTIDDALWSAVCHKLDTLGRVLDGRAAAVNGLMHADTALAGAVPPRQQQGAAPAAPAGPKPGSIQAFMAKAANRPAAGIAAAAPDGAAAAKWEGDWGGAGCGWDEGGDTRQDNAEEDAAKRRRLDSGGGEGGPSIKEEDWGGW